MSNFIIKDWMSNIKFNGQTFETFEDAWEHIFIYAEECEDDDYSDFYVDKIENN